MASAPMLDVINEQSASTDIATIVAQTPEVVLIDGRQRTSLYAHIEREIEAFVPDTSTAKGRAAIKSLAFKITKTKTAIDAAGKQLNEEARAKINVVDEARRDARNTLDMLAERVRKPLDEWEAAEEQRVKECRAVIDRIVEAGRVSLEDTAAGVRQRGTDIWAIALDADRFGDLMDEAQSAKNATVATLKAALERLTREEADRAELERLRAEAAERDRIEAEKAAEAEAERQRIEAEQLAEQQRLEAERAEADRIAAAEQAATERALREADERHQAELAAERERVATLEREAQAERDRVAETERRRAAQEAAEQAERDRLAADQARRERNREHRTAVQTAAKQALMTCGADEETARKIVLAIIAGEIPAVTLEF